MEVIGRYVYNVGMTINEDLIEKKEVEFWN